MSAVRKSKSWSETFSNWIPKFPFSNRHQTDKEIVFKQNVSTVSAPAHIPVTSELNRPRTVPPRPEREEIGESQTDSDSETETGRLQSTLREDHSYAKRCTLRTQESRANDNRKMSKSSKILPPKSKTQKRRSMLNSQKATLPDSETEMDVTFASEIGVGDRVARKSKTKSHAKAKSTYKTRPRTREILTESYSESESSADEIQDRAYGQMHFQPRNRRLRDPKPFDAKTLEWSDYHKHFSAVAEWNGWSAKEKAKQLVMSFDGEALKLLSELSEEMLQDYDLLVHELNRRYNPSERASAYKIEFRNRFRKANESVTEFAQALKRLVCKAFPNMPANALEQWVLDQFTLGLGNVELQRYVQFGHAKELNEAISLAIEYEAFESGIKLKKPYNAQKPSEIFAISNTSPAQMNTTEKSKNQNPFQGNGKSNSNSNSEQRKCHYCQHPGHLIKDCRKLKQKQKWEAQNSYYQTYSRPGQTNYAQYQTPWQRNVQSADYNNWQTQGPVFSPSVPQAPVRQSSSAPQAPPNLGN